MGCYGIGVTRVVAAAIEQNHDERGIIWPAAARAVRGRDRAHRLRPQRGGARRSPTALHDELEAAGIEVLLDDRGERPGVMFADLELIGIPHRITIGDRGLKEGNVEYQARRDATATPVPVADIAAFVESDEARQRRHERYRRAMHARHLGARRASAALAGLLAPLPAHAGAQVEERLAPSVATVHVSARSPTSRCPPTTSTRPELRAWLDADVAAARAAHRRRRARARTSSPPCITKPRAPGSIRSSCWA